MCLPHEGVLREDALREDVLRPVPGLMCGCRSSVPVRRVRVNRVQANRTGGKAKGPLRITITTLSIGVIDGG